jgi:hypothetical protein
MVEDVPGRHAAHAEAPVVLPHEPAGHSKHSDAPDAE